FDLPGGDMSASLLASADLCRAECARNSQCVAYTWVKETTRCHLKSRRPAPAANCSPLTCTSGVRRTKAPPTFNPPPVEPPCGACIPTPPVFPPWDSSLDWDTDRP